MVTDWSALAVELRALVKSRMTDDTVLACPQLLNLVRRRAQADLTDQACADAARRLIAISSQTAFDWTAFTPSFSVPGGATLAKLQQSIGPLFGSAKDGKVGTGVSHRQIEAAKIMKITERTYRDNLANILGQYTRMLAELDSDGAIWRAVFPPPELSTGEMLSNVENSLPHEVRDIIRLSESLSDDIASSISGTNRPTDQRIAATYVPRKIQSVLRARMVDASPGNWIAVVGEAGHGKSCLLWSLHRELASTSGVVSLLLSASWFLGDATSPALITTEGVARACEALLDHHERVIVLVDTADLLMHSESARRQTLAMMEQLSERGVSSIVTSRPVEADSLPLDAQDKIALRAYDEDEIRRALQVLIAQFCPNEPEPEPIDRLLDAVARNLPVEDVCRSPLLLRLLFELSAPLFPALEIDVTGVYRRYWSQRVSADSREVGLGTGPRGPSTANLAVPAGLFGIAMLALGTPEAPRDPLLRRAGEAAQRSAVAHDAHTLDQAADILVRRGVMHSVAGRVRFMHQTLFEFATAMALLERGSSAELHRMLELVLAEPDDMFAGAVLEQVLILAGEDPLLAPDVGHVIRRLIETANTSLQVAAIRIWAHHPQLHVDDDTLAIIKPDLLPVFAKVATTVHGSSRSDLMRQFSRLWEIGGSQTEKSVVEALVKIGRVEPAAVAGTVRRLRVVETCLADRFDYVVSQDAVTDLVLANVHDDREWARARLLEIIAAVGLKRHGKRRTVLILKAISQNWRIVGDGVFLAALVNTVADAQGHHDSDAVLIRRGLGAIYELHWRTALDNPGYDASERSRRWREIVEATTAGLEADDEGIVPGSQLIALALTLRELSPGHPWIQETLASVLSMQGPAAPYQVARGFFALLLQSKTPAGNQATVELGQLLNGLIGVSNGDDRQHIWADVARRCLIHRDVPADRVAAAVQASNVGSAIRSWREEDLLLILAPSAAAGGHPVAMRAVDEMLANPDSLSERDKGILLDQCRERRHQSSLLDELTVVLTLARRRLATIAELAEEDPDLEPLRRRRGVVAHLIDEYLDGDDKSQRESAWVWRKLCHVGLLDPHANDLLARIGSLRDPVAKAEVIGMLPEVISADNLQHSEAVDLLFGMISIDEWWTKGIQPTKVDAQKPVVLDAVRDSLLRLIAYSPSVDPSTWPVAHALACAPRLTGTKQVDLTGFRCAATLLVRLANEGHVEAAYGGVTDMMESLRSGGFDRKKLVNGSFSLRSAIRAALRCGTDNQAVALVEQISDAPARASIIIVQIAAQQRFEAVRPILLGLQAHQLPDGVATAIDAVLRRRSRMIGSRTMPEILIPAM